MNYIWEEKEINKTYLANFKLICFQSFPNSSTNSQMALDVNTALTKAYDELRTIDMDLSSLSGVQDR
jgi:hypothetical protein